MWASFVCILEEKKKEEEIVYTVENRPESFEDTEEPEEEQAEEASRTTEATSNVGPWYTAQSPEGYTYYWHDVTGGEIHRASSHHLVLHWLIRLPPVIKV